MTVLDASAVLALVHDEPGADQVASELALSDFHTVTDIHELVRDIHTAVVRED